MNPDQPLLERGDRGSAVYDLQQVLFQLNFLDPDDLTGFFNDKTEEAVKKFQQKRGLPATGIVTNFVWHELGKAMEELKCQTS